ncbi:hypothetical protein K488DRAFT_50813 [Vararia minispora EC-137]|uniref:Uncharacterized protein n=1 Tax=Vararia minispora EC-137 TaxID=1314806 RepID=A0ACB8QJN9_9AGAM|nr:hypothetical protein K488DRAFT_50813 [Vararia minispora EC-137]
MRLYRPHTPSDAELAALALADESTYRFPSFSTNDAITLGLSLRKRFRASSRHQKHGRCLVLAIQTAAGAPLFACAVGDGTSGEDWAVLEGAIAVVRRTGHSSFYVEKGLIAGRAMREVEKEKEKRIYGGAFPIYLENAPCCPIAVVGCYSGSSDEDHRMVVTTVRDYIRKMHEDTAPALSDMPASPRPPRDSQVRRLWGCR